MQLNEGYTHQTKTRQLLQLMYTIKTLFNPDPANDHDKTLKILTWVLACMPLELRK